MKTKLPSNEPGQRVSVVTLREGDLSPPLTTAPQRGHWVIDEDARRRSLRITAHVVATVSRWRETYAKRRAQSETPTHATLTARGLRVESVKPQLDALERNRSHLRHKVVQSPPHDRIGTPTERSYYSLIGLRETEFLTSKKRSGIYEAIAAGTFPKQVKLGGEGRRVAFVYGEVMDWNRAQIAQRDREIAHPKG